MSSNQPSPASYPSEAVRTAVSLVIFIHLFCVAIALTCSFSCSELGGKLVSLFFPYVRALHLDPNYLPVDRRIAALPPIAFHLTAGEGETRMHQWLLTSRSGDTWRFPDARWPWQHRGDRLARVAAYFSERLEADEVPAEIVKSLCNHVRSRLTDTELAGPIHVQCLRHQGSADARTFEVEGANVQVIYEADVWFSGSDESPTINVLKRVPRGQSAPPKE